MQEAGRIVTEAHRVAGEMLQPGVTTGDIDRAIEALFQESGAEPLFKGYPGVVPFPAVTCISVNEQVVHGIPGDRVLEAGDLVSIDTGCRYHGWCGDAAWTYPVGEVDSERRRLLEVGRGALEMAIREMERSRMWSEVAAAVASFVEKSGFGLVEEFSGHGIGREMHEDPDVPCCVMSERICEDFALQPGLVLCIEPMVTAGDRQVRILDDHWTVETRDQAPSVHFEHTVALTEQGAEVLTDGIAGVWFGPRP